LRKKLGVVHSERVEVKCGKGCSMKKVGDIYTKGETTPAPPEGNTGSCQQQTTKTKREPKKLTLRGKEGEWAKKRVSEDAWQKT